MNIGSLYLVKKLFWLLFPTKETALAVRLRCNLSAPCTAAPAAVLPAAANYWSNQYNCEVAYFSPDSYIVFLEEDGKFKKVLTSDGRIGWTWFDGSYNNCFEEANL